MHYYSQLKLTAYNFIWLSTHSFPLFLFFAFLLCIFSSTQCTHHSHHFHCHHHQFIYTWLISIWNISTIAPEWKKHIKWFAILLCTLSDRWVGFSFPFSFLSLSCHSMWQAARSQWKEYRVTHQSDLGIFIPLCLSLSFFRLQLLSLVAKADFMATWSELKEKTLWVTLIAVTETIIGRLHAHCHWISLAWNDTRIHWTAIYPRIELNFLAIFFFLSPLMQQEAKYCGQTVWQEDQRERFC